MPGSWSVAPGAETIIDIVERKKCTVCCTIGLLAVVHINRRAYLDLHGTSKFCVWGFVFAVRLSLLSCIVSSDIVSSDIVSSDIVLSDKDYLDCGVLFPAHRLVLFLLLTSSIKQEKGIW